MTKLNAKPARDIRNMVANGEVTPEQALAHVRSVHARYTAQNKPETKLTKWANLIDHLVELCDTPAPATYTKPAPKPKAKVKAKPQAATTYTKAPKRLSKRAARDLIASKKILSNDDKAAIVDLLARI